MLHYIESHFTKSSCTGCCLDFCDNLLSLKIKQISETLVMSENFLAAPRIFSIISQHVYIWELCSEYSTSALVWPRTI